MVAAILRIFNVGFIFCMSHRSKRAMLSESFSQPMIREARSLKGLLARSKPQISRLWKADGGVEINIPTVCGWKTATIILVSPDDAM